MSEFVAAMHDVAASNVQLGADFRAAQPRVKTLTRVVRILAALTVINLVGLGLNAGTVLGVSRDSSQILGLTKSIKTTQTGNTDRAKAEQQILAILNEAAGPKAQAASRQELLDGLACILNRIDFDLGRPGVVPMKGCG